MSKSRKNYTINRKLLIRYRNGDITASMPKNLLLLLEKYVS